MNRRVASHIAEADPRFRDSVRNLLHYLSLRHLDLRNIQERLAALGLSSLGHIEAHTLASLYAVRRALERAGGSRVPRSLEPAAALTEKAYHPAPRSPMRRWPNVRSA
jgi:pyruvate kinase